MTPAPTDDRFAELVQAGQNAVVAGDYAKAELHYREALAVAELFGSADYRVAVCKHHLGCMAQMLGKGEEAELLLLHAVAIVRTFYGPAHPFLVSCLSILGLHYHCLGKLNDALDLMRQSLLVLKPYLQSEARLDTDPALPVRTCVLTGDVFVSRGQYEDAQLVYTCGMKYGERHLGADDLAMAELRIAIGTCLRAQGQVAEGVAWITQGISKLEQVSRPDHPRLGLPLYRLGVCQSLQGQYPQAKATLRRAWGIMRKTRKNASGATADCLSALAELADTLGKPLQAFRLQRRATEMAAVVFGPDHPVTAHHLVKLARQHVNLDQPDQAERLLRRAWMILSTAQGENPRNVARLASNLAAVLYIQEKYEAAEPAYRRAVALVEEMFGPKHPRLAVVLLEFSQMLGDLGREGEAASLKARAEEIREAANSASES